MAAFKRQRSSSENIDRTKLIPFESKPDFLKQSLITGFDLKQYAHNDPSFFKAEDLIKEDSLNLKVTIQERVQ